MNDPEVENHCFIDTNIWLYALIEGNDPAKTVRAKEVIESSGTVFVSTQVINEVCINLIKKARFSEVQIQQVIDSFHTKYLVVELFKPLLLKASMLREKHQFSFWDSLIVAGALSANTSILYSEDMHHGMMIEKQLQIVNPLRAI